MALSDEQRHLIAYLVEKGKSIGEIKEVVGCSESSIKRIKKEVALHGEDTTSKSSYIDYNPKDLKLTSRLQKEKVFFEDPEEGWIFGTTGVEDRMKKNCHGKWWVCIVYPESASKDWKERLQKTGLEIAISPLHDKDKWEHDSPEKEIIDSETGEIIRIPAGVLYKAGDPKKAHWHVIIKTDIRVSFKEINAEIRPITNGPLMQKCYGLKGAYEYFLHLNNPERYQYDRDEIEEFNGFTIEPNEREKKEMLQEIIKTVHEEGIDTMERLLMRYNDSCEYTAIIAVKAYVLGRLIDEVWRRKNPDYAKPIRIIKDERM